MFLTASASSDAASEVVVGSTTGIGLPDAAVVGDFTGDGLDDIAWHQGSTLFMLQATGNGTFSIAGSSAGITIPDWAGGGIDDTAGKAEVYWHQPGTIFVLQWAGTGWSVINTTTGISTPTPPLALTRSNRV